MTFCLQGKCSTTKLKRLLLPKVCSRRSLLAMNTLMCAATVILALFQAKCVLYYIKEDIRNIYTASIANSVLFALSWAQPRSFRPRGTACLFTSMFVNALGEVVGFRSSSQPQIAGQSEHYRLLNLICLSVLLFRCIHLRAAADCATFILLVQAGVALGAVRLGLWLYLGGSHQPVAVVPLLNDTLFTLNSVGVALFVLDLTNKARRFRAVIKESF